MIETKQFPLHFLFFISFLSRTSWLPVFPMLAVNIPGDFSPTHSIPSQNMGHLELLTWAESSFNPVLHPWAWDNLTLVVCSLGIKPIAHVPALVPASAILSLGIFCCSLNLHF